ncbi:hypothetical protein F2P79_010844 [Pimephales promelas]|nr:hypothetical protein F2P79_010844 [Pimephales promelas]
MACVCSIPPEGNGEMRKSETNGTTPSDVESPAVSSLSLQGLSCLERLQKNGCCRSRGGSIRWKPAQHWSLIRGLQIGFSVSKVKACKRP